MNPMTHAEWWLEAFSEGLTGTQGIYSGADIVLYGTDGNDVLLYCDGSKLTVPMDGEAVAS